MHVHTGLRAAGATDPGLLRGQNEDRYHYDPARGIFVVIDGVGGQAAGEQAAETALGLVRARLERETGSVEDRVREAIGLANDEIYRLASLHAERRGMACVLTVAVVANGDVVIGHVGDTRLYKVRAGRIAKLTRDHSPVGEREDAGELTERAAMQHPRRNEVYRDVGSERHDPDEPGFIDVQRHPFEPDAALLLCSDGLTDMVPSSTILETVRGFAGHPYEVVRALVDAANAAGGKDNVTAVYVEGPRFADGDDTRDLRRARAAAPAEPRPGRPPRSRAERWRLLSLIALLLAVAGAAGYLQRERLLGYVRPGPAASTAAGPIVVRPGESIGAAVRAAPAGATVIVDPGEYRERLELKSGVAVVSRVPRAAVLRLPGHASESDPAVVAFEVAGAALSGFRIVGDAATPLGAAIVMRNSTASLSDLEIEGASGTGVEYIGSLGGSLVAAYFHDNRGAAIAVRGSAAPRIAHNVFGRNAPTERTPGTLIVEADARPSITANTFLNQRPEAVVLPAGADAAAIARDNWFVPPPVTDPARREGRARR